MGTRRHGENFSHRCPVGEFRLRGNRAKSRFNYRVPLWGSKLRVASVTPEVEPHLHILATCH
ncbi:MAG: hypothetical protein KME21_16510 [Desmonostoc vinosum HA7617-LM4]|nr:hypothetical protein [Desmonostoc vinosum HA7617-LM4]